MKKNFIGALKILAIVSCFQSMLFCSEISKSQFNILDSQRIFKIYDDNKLVDLSLPELKINIIYAVKKSQELLATMQYELGVIENNAINMQASKEYLDGIENFNYASNWILYLQQDPGYPGFVCGEQVDPVIFSPQVEECCEKICYLEQEVRALSQYVVWFMTQHKRCSQLMDKACWYKRELDAQQNNLAEYIQHNVDDHVMNIRRTIDEQIQIDSQFQFNYQESLNLYQKYDLMIRYKNNARLQKAATIIQMQIKNYAQTMKNKKVQNLENLI